MIEESPRPQGDDLMQTSHRRAVEPTATAAAPRRTSAARTSRCARRAARRQPPTLARRDARRAASPASVRSSELSPTLAWSHAVGHHYNDLCAACWFTYLLAYLEGPSTGLSETLAGAVMLAGQLADGLATPIVGLLDRTGPECQIASLGLGRRKLWHAGGTALVLVNFGLAVFSGCSPLPATTARRPRTSAPARRSSTWGGRRCGVVPLAAARAPPGARRADAAAIRRLCAR